MNEASALYVGTVTHRRLRPVRHALAYRVFSLLVDLDELPALAARCRLLSLNRFNVFSIHERDHGADAGGLRERVDHRLRDAGLPTGGRVQLLTMPRLLGYAFNPLSVYFCHDADGALRALLYEVRNTFGERHDYLLEVDPAHRAGERVTQRCTKEFHVSPFLALEMSYRFSVRAPQAADPHLDLRIGVHDEAGAVLVARYEATRRRLDDAALLRVFVSHPLLTLKVVAAIHWEALQLLAKGVRWRPRPAAPAHPVSIVKSKGP
jgi:DUF1365 family protein